jgi:hypothetical protein
MIWRLKSSGGMQARPVSGICALALVLTIGVTSALAGRPRQDDSGQAGRLNARISPANPRRYKSVHDAEKWQNPILVIRADGIQVISKGLRSGDLTVASNDLRRTLIDLPVTAWPYGRVVVVQDIGIHPSDLSDGPAITNNRRVTLAILKTLDVTVEEWPSA